MQKIKLYIPTWSLFWLFLSLPVIVNAQVLIATDDTYYVPFDPFENPVLVEPFGVMENDTLDGNNAGEEGATVLLVSGVTQGTLICPGIGPGLCADGSFEYRHNLSDYDAFTEGFNGLDSFTYQLISAGATSQVATVTLSACTKGPVFACWKRPAYLAKLAELGLTHFFEGQQGIPWDVTRNSAVSSVDSMDIRWTSNHPANTSIATSATPDSKVGGEYLVLDTSHGFATCELTSCSPTICDVDSPPESCLPYDGVSGSVINSNSVLRAVGVYIDDVFGGPGSGRIEIILDGVTHVGFNNAPSYLDGYFAVIDTRPAGFSHFEIRETSGKIGQQMPIWLADFNIVLESPIVADGDLAPRGQPDGVINAADYMIAMQIVLQQITPTADEIKHGDLYPVAGGDGQITLSDAIRLMKLVLN
ncbi:MAG: hypothetical protein V3W04_05745 [Gammaproteobacteria bacterium]